MEQAISFFNWSLKKLLLTECDAFNKARIKILYTILVFSILKTCIAIPIALQNQQSFNTRRSTILFIIILIILKLLLAKRMHIKIITHIMIWLGLFLIWSNIFVSIQFVNVATVQFIFMIVLTSFYLLNRKFAIIYSFGSILPIILLSVFSNRILFPDIVSHRLASPGYEIIVVLNFITIIITHYLFQQAFSATITEKEGLNSQLHMAVKEANQATESKSDFLSTMSHELRTPLNSVIGISELLLNDSYSKDQEENLRILRFSALSLHSLINDILDYNKLGSEKLNLENIPVDISELMNDVSSGLKFQAKQKNIKFILDIDEAIVNQLVITDPTRITQIVYNLTGNAIKFTEHGHVSVSLKALCLHTNAIDIRFSIADTGIGISEDKQAAIFEPFTQASSSTTRNFGGTGLGLAIVKRLLALFESNIYLKSVPGKGSTFFFDISFKSESKPAPTHAVDSEIIYDLTNLQILIAEDNPVNRLLMTKVFAKWNNKPEFATNGQEAIEKIMLNHYDIILMDLHMPVLNGYEATSAIRSLPDPVKSGVRIIALTASASANLDEKIKGAGMNDYVLKPFKLNELYHKLKKVTISPDSNLSA